MNLFIIVVFIIYCEINYISYVFNFFTYKMIFMKIKKL